MTVEPFAAGVEERLALAQRRLAALAVADPVHTLWRQQQVQVVGPVQQLLFDPRRAIAEQGAAPEHIAQQMGVENQQLRSACPCSVLPGQLTLSDGRDVAVKRIAALPVDELANVFTDHDPAEAPLDLNRQPALATRLGAGQDQNLHRASTRSLRHSRQP
ncbi:Unknown protein sequence [Pseudomonas syringae pv. cilantro]|uniref:Uncharacterized protein n=1 Tax=Pseudomonas syringae pv. cilantro TaxID=81035 RepID=A0A0N0XDI6_PSESX|nr:Unknown protein sequence [Pseudomonas syringae pv. cilantro]